MIWKEYYRYARNINDFTSYGRKRTYMWGLVQGTCGNGEIKILGQETKTREVPHQ